MMTTRERVEELRRERSFTHRASCAACEINATMTKYFGKSWEFVRDLVFAFILIILCGLDTV